MKTIDLNKQFYPINTLEKAAAAFHEIADFKISDNGRHHTIEATLKQSADIEMVLREFSNYCLVISKKEITSSAFRTIK